VTIYAVCYVLRRAFLLPLLFLDLFLLNQTTEQMWWY